MVSLSQSLYDMPGPASRMDDPKCYMTFWDMTIYNDTLN